MSKDLPSTYTQENLVSSSPEDGALLLDPAFINAWGIAIRPAGFGGHWWVANTDTSRVTLYVGDSPTVSFGQDWLSVIGVPGAPGEETIEIPIDPPTKDGEPRRRRRPRPRRCCRPPTPPARCSAAATPISSSTAPASPARRSPRRRAHHRQRGRHHRRLGQTGSDPRKRCTPTAASHSAREEAASPPTTRASLERRARKRPPSLRSQFANSIDGSTANGGRSTPRPLRGGVGLPRCRRVRTLQHRARLRPEPRRGCAGIAAYAKVADTACARTTSPTIPAAQPWRRTMPAASSPHSGRVDGAGLAAGRLAPHAGAARAVRRPGRPRRSPRPPSPTRR